jgi:uncharacterized membrane protein (UPF0136 family)
MKNYLLSPLTFFTGFYLYQVFFAPIVYIFLAPQLVYLDIYVQVFLICLLYLGSVFIGWVLSPKLGQRLATYFMDLSCLNYKNKTKKHKTLVIGILFFSLYIISFILLAYFSGAGTLWITDSRYSYQFYRNGVGVFYAVAGTFLRLSYTVFIFKDSSVNFSWFTFISKTIFFMFISYFLGSKGIILSLFITALVYYNYYINSIKLSTLLIIFFLILIVVTLLQLVQGTANEISETFLYADYFQNTCEFIRRFDEFEYQWGQAFLSNLWSFVPRGIYPDKPYEYGQLLINQVLFPGLAEKSFTPGLLPWAADYLDFGVIGVLISGLFRGLSLGWAHEYFLNKNKSITGFIILLQIGGIAEVFSFIPIPIILIVALPLFSLVYYMYNGISKLPQRF